MSNQNPHDRFLMAIKSSNDELEQRMKELEEESRKLMAAVEILQASEERYKGFFENSTDMVFTLDLEGNFTDVNSAAELLTGYTKAELYSMNFKEYISPEAHEEIFQIFRRISVSGEPVQDFPVQITDKNGSTKYFETSVIPLKKSGEIVGFQGTSRDVTERVEAIRQLQESEEKYRTILDSVDEGYFEVDLEGNFTYMSNWLRRESDRPPDRLMGMNYGEYMPPETKEKIFRAFNQVFKTGKPATKIDADIITSSGRPRTVELSASLMTDRDGNPVGFRGVSRDVTERKRTEEALRESEEKYRTILESIEDGYYEVDLAGDFTFFNDAMCRILGYPRDELMGMNNRDYMDKETAKKVYQTFNNVYKTGEPSKGVDWEFISKEGTERHVEASVSLIKDERGQPAGFRGILRDVTERKQAEALIRESEEKHRNILESLEEAYFEVDLEGNYTFCNDSLTKILGYSRDELMGMNKRDVMLPKTALEIDEVFTQILETGKSFGKDFYEIVRKDGTHAFHGMTASLMRDKNGRPIGFRGLAKDITELRMTEEENKKLEARLIQAQKMEAIGTLAGGIAHNFNNLLMGIQGNASLMLLDISPDSPYYPNLKNIEKQVQSGAKLTRQLLGYAREGRYEVKPIDLNRLIEETADTFATTRKDITVHQDLAGNLFGVVAEQGQLEQVLLNLYVNAADAMPGGGKLFLSTKNVTHEDIKNKAYVPEPGNYVLLGVQDTGTGMDEKTMAQIFTPFFTTKGLASGTGLGLASAYGIVKGHGGYIDVESTVNMGTTFSIYLPATSEVPQNDLEWLSGDLEKGTETVLIVDDEKIILETGKQMLEAMGYRVLLAANGQEALEIYERMGEQIDIVLLDMVMPNMGGGETYDRLKEIDPAIKVLLSSGYSLDGQATEILERGCDAFIQKPFSLEQLSRSLRMVLE